jgi:hypothetical protein
MFSISDSYFTIFSGAGKPLREKYMTFVRAFVRAFVWAFVWAFVRAPEMKK